MRAVWQDLPVLYQHFRECSEDPSRNGKEKSKYLGLSKKIQSWFFICEVGMLMDSLFYLMQFSKYLQSDDLNVTSILIHTDDIRNKLLALKTRNGDHLNEFYTQFDKDGTFKGIVVRKGIADENRSAKSKSQFFQALYDNIGHRFPAEQFLS